MLHGTEAPREKTFETEDRSLPYPAMDGVSGLNSNEKGPCKAHLARTRN